MSDLCQKAVGIDGYSTGWVAVELSASKQAIRFLGHIEEIHKFDFDVGMIDMPIGMPVQGYRQCDREARALLGRNQSRVFLGARRSYLHCSSHPQATATAKALDGKGVSIQTFCLVPKLKQLDAVMNSKKQERLMECHPELVFWRLNDGQPVPSKRTEKGIELRKNLLKMSGIHSLDELLTSRLGTGAKTDDVLDACACAIAARDKSPSRPPLGAELDPRGLKMEIYY